ncbi:MAG: hypothetical protein ACE5ER_06035 [Nitrospinaceae bacterium]
MKRYLLAVIGVFLAWSVLDFVFHGVLLKSEYEATAHIWRPLEEVNMVLANLVTLVLAVLYTGLYQTLIHPKNMTRALKMGGYIGLMSGISTGLGFYCYMLIPLTLAAGWMVTWTVEMLAASAVVGAILKEPELAP